MYFKQIFEPKLAQYSYLIGCQQTGGAIVVDPMRDIDRYDRIAESEGLKITAAADTHIHADYLTGLRAFAERGVTVYASDEGGEEWRYEWLVNSKYPRRLLKDGDRFSLGNIIFEAWHTPGHTPEHLSIKVTDGAGADAPMGLLTGDFIFVGDVGRPDLLESAAGYRGVMKSSARTLFHSVAEFRDLPEYLQIWPGHGAGSACGKALGAVPESTVGYELRFNSSIKAAENEHAFVDYILEGQPEPPLYFARMKRDNRSGPKLLARLPRPGRITPSDLVDKTRTRGNTVIDTRERSAFTAGHIPGSLLIPLDSQFPTVAGSFVREEEAIYLIVEEQRVEEAVRDLIRIGLDDIRGFITPADLVEYHDRGGRLNQTERITFEDLHRFKDKEANLVLDVRRSSEFDEKHIEGAMNIAHTRLLDRLDELPRNQNLLVHCQTGNRASVSAALLEREGFSVRWIDDHIRNWSLPVADKS